MSDTLKVGLGLLIKNETESENLDWAADACWDSVLTTKITVTEFIDAMIEIETKKNDN